MSAHVDKAKSIFLNAADIASASARQAFIDEACKGDDNLRREVHDLLRHHEQAGKLPSGSEEDFLLGRDEDGHFRSLFLALVEKEQAKECHGQTAVAESPIRQLGDYRILREVGRGGMGVVYEAEQVSLGRRVALKVLRHTPHDDLLRQRFHREARAAAQLHHTHIVPVFEIGEDQDVCWYAMQLILGQGLDQIIEDLQQTRQAPADTVHVPGQPSSQTEVFVEPATLTSPLAEPSTADPSEVRSAIRRGRAAQHGVRGR
jgi:hypothetical protein